MGRNTLCVGHHSIYNFRSWWEVREQGALRRRVSFPDPLGVLSCEVPGSDRPCQHHCEVFNQELGAQRCLNSGELQSWKLGVGELFFPIARPPVGLTLRFPRFQ